MNWKTLAADLAVLLLILVLCVGYWWLIWWVLAFFFGRTAAKWTIGIAIVALVIFIAREP